MPFNSPAFLFLFFPLTALCYFRFAGRRSGQAALFLLTLASLLFTATARQAAE